MAKEKKWGYVDREGNFVIAPSYDGAWSFHGGLAAVAVEWARGYIDRDGDMVIPPKFQYAGPFCDGKALVQLDGLWGYIKSDGSWAVEPHEEPGHPELNDVKLSSDLTYDALCGAFSDTPADTPTSSEGLTGACKGKKYGYIDESGKFVIKPQFIQAKPFSEGLAAVLVAIP